MSHVNDQNWFAVALDFFIVVSGVLVAFQLSTWGQERAARDRAEQSLVQLYEESELIATYNINMVGVFGEWLRQQEVAVAAFSAGSLEGVEPAEFEFGTVTSLFYPSIAPPRRVYDELSSAGLLREIHAPAAMQAVDNYYGSLDFIEGQLPFFRQNTDFLPHRRHQGINNIYDPTHPSGRRIEIDFEMLSQDEEFLSGLVGQLRNQRQFNNYRRDMMATAVQMCIALAEAVDRACEAAEGLSESDLISPNFFRNEEDDDEEAGE